MFYLEYCPFSLKTFLLGFSTLGFSILTTDSCFPTLKKKKILSYHSVKVFQNVIIYLFIHSVILNGNILCKFLYPVNWVNLL